MLGLASFVVSTSTTGQEPSSVGYRFEYFRGDPVVYANVSGTLCRLIVHTGAPVNCIDERIVAKIPADTYDVVALDELGKPLGIRGLEISVGDLSADRYDMVLTGTFSKSNRWIGYEFDGILGAPFFAGKSLQFSEGFFSLTEGRTPIGDSSIELPTIKDEYGLLNVPFENLLNLKRACGLAILSSGFVRHDAQVLEDEFREMSEREEIFNVRPSGILPGSNVIQSPGGSQKYGNFQSDKYGLLGISNPGEFENERHIGLSLLAKAGVTLDFSNEVAYVNSLKKSTTETNKHSELFHYVEGLPIVPVTVPGKTLKACFALNDRWHSLSERVLNSLSDGEPPLSFVKCETGSPVFGVRFGIPGFDSGFDAPYHVLNAPIFEESQEVELRLGLPFLRGKYLEFDLDSFEMGVTALDANSSKQLRELPIHYVDGKLQCKLDDLLPECRCESSITLNPFCQSKASIQLTVGDIEKLESANQLGRTPKGDLTLRVQGTDMVVTSGEESQAFLGILKNLGLRVEFAPGSKAAERKEVADHKLFVRR